MRVASINIWNVQGPAVRQHDLIRELEAVNPDVVLFQEVSFEKIGWPQSRTIANALGHRYEKFFYAGSWKARSEGLAISSRFPMLSTFSKPLPVGSDGMGRIVCGARLEYRSTLLDACTLHLAYPMSAGDERARQADVAKAFLLQMNKDFEERPLILGGDFNDIPDSRAVISFLSGHASLTDVFKSVPAKRRWTFSSANSYGEPALGLDRCIDYMLVSSQCRWAGAELFGTGPKFVSDHFGVYADIVVPHDDALH